MHEQTFEKRRRPWLRWLKRIGWGLLTLLVVAICAWAWWHYSVQKRLDEVLVELDRVDPGWRLEDIEAAREQIPEEENSARVVVAAGKLLPEPWPPKKFDNIFDRLAPEEQLADDDFARLTRELDNLRQVLAEAYKLTSMPRGRHRLDHRQIVFAEALTDQKEVGRVARLLTYDALRHAQNGELRKALLACRASLNAGLSLGDEPLLISQLLRSSAITRACQAVERTLAQGEPPPEEIVALQKALADEDAFPDLFIAARGERAAASATAEAIENGKMSASDLIGDQTNWGEELVAWWLRDNIRNEHPTMLTLMSRWVAITQLPFHQQAEAERQLEQEARGLPFSAFLTRLLVPAVVKGGDSSRRKHASVRCTIVALAAERYRQANKSWPVSLDKLCPQFLADVPRDPFDGELLRYRRVEDGVVIYSVSSDGVDNNGNLDREHPNQRGVDVGCRLWDVAKRRQPPWPKLPPNPE
jgi:hypothetical protein